MIRQPRLGDRQSAMQTRRSTIGILSFLLLAAYPVLAGSGGGYDLLWSTVDAGGGLSTGGGYELRGTIGQPDAGDLTGDGGYSLTGGFWHAVSPPDVLGDCDGDGLLSLSDYDCLYQCLSDPGPDLPAECAAFDFDGDGDTDFRDFAHFQRVFGTSG